MVSSNVVNRNKQLVKDILAIQKRLNESVRRLDKAGLLHESLFISQMYQYSRKIQDNNLTNIFQFSKKKNLIFRTPGDILAELNIQDEQLKNLKLKEIRARYKKFESYETRTIEGVKRHRIKQLIGMYVSQFANATVASPSAKVADELRALLESDKTPTQLENALNSIIKKYQSDQHVAKVAQMFSSVPRERINEVFKLLREQGALQFFQSDYVMDNIDKIASKINAEILQKIDDVKRAAAGGPVSYSKAVEYLAGDYEDFYNM